MCVCVCVCVCACVCVSLHLSLRWGAVPLQSSAVDLRSEARWDVPFRCIALPQVLLQLALKHSTADVKELRGRGAGEGREGGERGQRAIANLLLLLRKAYTNCH